MNRIFLTALLIGLTYSTSANAQFGFNDIDLVFEQQSIGGGNVDYALEVDGVSFFFGSCQGTLTAPGETVFDDNRSVGGLSFQQVSSLFFGEWSISQFDYGTGVVGTQTFTFSPFTLGDVFSEIPTITSPAISGQQSVLVATPDASGVFGADFSLDWEYSSGAIPTSRTISTSTSGDGDSDITDFVTGANSALVSTVLDPGATSVDFSYTVGSFENIDGFVSAVVADDPATSEILTVGAQFRTLSQASTVTVSVPEPNAAFISFAGMAVIGSRRRKT